MVTMKPDTREQLPGMELHLGNHPPCRLPTRRLIEEALVPHDWFVSRTAHRPSQQLFNITHQAVVGRNPNRVLRSTLFECFVDVRLRKGGIGPGPNFLAQLLLPLDLRQQELLPTNRRCKRCRSCSCAATQSPDRRTAAAGGSRSICSVCCRRSVPARRRPESRCCPYLAPPATTTPVLRPLQSVPGSSLPDRTSFRRLRQYLSLKPVQA